MSGSGDTAVGWIGDLKYRRLAGRSTKLGLVEAVDFETADFAEEDAVDIFFSLTMAGGVSKLMVALPGPGRPLP